MEYRVYFVGPDGHFINRRDIDVADDQAAIQAVQDLADGQAIEVWQDNRMVTKIDARAGSRTPGNLFKLFRAGARRGTTE